MESILGELKKASAQANRTGPCELGDFTASKRVVFISAIATGIGIRKKIVLTTISDQVRELI
jgi:hypothetical protein